MDPMFTIDPGPLPLWSAVNMPGEVSAKAEVAADKVSAKASEVASSASEKLAKGVASVKSAISSDTDKKA